MDEYLAKSLKNWAACSRPPADGRDRLLKAAAYPPLSPQQRFLRFFFTARAHSSSHALTLTPHGEWTIRPAFYSSACSFHFASTWRLAT
jgi:hypothetical protein